MTHRHYCTYFDQRYLPLGLALHASLLQYGDEFTLWVLALDEITAGFLETIGSPSIQVVRLAQLEAFDPALKAIESTRSRVEYYFTCSPCLPRYVMANKDVNEITYLDSDLWFFASPERVFDELAGASIAIVPHRYSGSAARTHVKFGLYNVGWLTFRDDVNGSACLEWWRSKCIEWCYDRVEPERYADQKYLDYFEGRFHGVHAIAHPGANLAPWNVAGHVVARGENGVLVDDRQLVFFHFQGLRQITPRTYDSNLASYGARMTPDLRHGVFEPYLMALQEAEDFVAARLLSWGGTRSLRRAGLHRLHLHMSNAWRTFRARVSGVLVDVPDS